MAPQYCGELGKTANCQVLFSLPLASGEVPVGLRLFLPSVWTADPNRCAAAGVSEAAFCAALEERTRERVPLEWARITGNQGVALMLLAERSSDTTKAKEAIWQIGVAWEMMLDGGNTPAAAYFNKQMTNAYILIHRLDHQISRE